MECALSQLLGTSGVVSPQLCIRYLCVSSLVSARYMAWKPASAINQGSFSWRTSYQKHLLWNDYVLYVEKLRTQDGTYTQIKLTLKRASILGFEAN